ncbi:MAG: hypothetical protein ACRDF5_12825 [bacterium]
MRTLVRFGQEQSGVAMISALLAIFILTVVVAGLTMATMGETGVSFDQTRANQALHLAEAGAYRALAELRRRMVNDLDANVRAATPLTLQGYCNSNEGWRIVATYGGAGWVDDAMNRRAVLAGGTAGAPIEVLDAAGAVLGSFYATIYVRPADNSPPNPNVCISSGVESYQMLFDYFIVATGITRDAQRTICLKNPGNVTNCGEWVAAAAPGAPNPGDPVFDSAPASHGWMVLVEKASYSRWALMLLTSSAVWLTDSSSFNGPVHTNDRFLIWGDPTFGSSVAQTQPTVQFGNGGSPVLLAADENPPEDEPIYQATRLALGAASIAAPTNNNPWWAVLGDDPARAGMPSNQDVRRATTALVDNTAAVPNGVYFMDQCGNPTCGGIFVQGSVANMVLAVESGKQTIIVIPSNLALPPKKYILDSATDTRECTGPPAYATCVSKGKGFNGMVFVKGAINYTAGNPQTGLYGTVQRDTRLTIATDGRLAITDHVVYESPPVGANDPIPNVLGLYSWCSTPPTCPARNVVVAGALAPNNLFIDASVLAPWGMFWVEGWNTLPDKGTLHFLGGTVQNTFGAWGGFATDAMGNVTGYTGYGREMTFDARFLTNNAPPFFPLTNQYAAPRYPRLTPDPLYDRPLWEELTSP